MGDEARVTARYGDRASEGKALLETDELIFRGDFRLKIPLRQVSSVEAADGRLTVAFGDESAEFAIGPAAARWADKIRNPKTLLDKLGLKEGQQIDLVDVADEEFRSLLHERGIAFAEKARPGSDVVLFGAESAATLGRLAQLRDSIARDGTVWVVAPKGGREPREAEVLESGKRAGSSTSRSPASRTRTRRTSSSSRASSARRTRATGSGGAARRAPARRSPEP